jgi:hypothetical protein
VESLCRVAVVIALGASKGTTEQASADLAFNLPLPRDIYDYRRLSNDIGK